MAKKNKKPQGHCRCCSRRGRPYRAARWLGLVCMVYRAMRDHWLF